VFCKVSIADENGTAGPSIIYIISERLDILITRWITRDPSCDLKRNESQEIRFF